MEWLPITKDLSHQQPTPHLIDYQHAYEYFSWDAIRQKLVGLPNNQGLNIAHEAVDCHANGPLANRVAIHWLGKDGHQQQITYAQLKERSNRFANLLQKLQIGKQDRVFSLCDRTPEFGYAVLGTLKNTSVFCPLYTAFGPKPIAQRLTAGCGKVLVTTKRLYNKKILTLRASIPSLRYVLLIDSDTDLDEETLSLPRLMEQAAPEFSIPPTSPEDMALLHFTSGTTGSAKGVLHTHQAILTDYVTGRDIFDLHPEDIFCCTAAAGWVTATFSGTIAPLLHGVSNIISAQSPAYNHWYQTLVDQKVTIWQTEPTTLRKLMTKSGPEKDYLPSALRLIFSVGEPLSPEVIQWSQNTLGQPVHDTWGQAETGGIMIANFPANTIRPGSMGKPLPGIEVAIVRYDGENLSIDNGLEQEGELALKTGWPSMFCAYLNNEERYNQCFVNGWYLTGDLVKRDADGYFWFIGRVDDIIKTAGYMVSPFEIETLLAEHPAIAESGVIGIPEPTMGATIKAFVTLRPEFEANDQLRRDILTFTLNELGPAMAPKEIVFRATLPKTRSGKIMRRLLKATELGLPESDISSLKPIFRDWADIYREAIINQNSPQA